MEFLDINFTKDSSFLLHAFYWRIFKKNQTHLWFKNTYKKIHDTRKLGSIREKHCVERKKEGRKPDEDSSLRRLEFTPRNLDSECPSRIPSLFSSKRREVLKKHMETHHTKVEKKTPRPRVKQEATDQEIYRWVFTSVADPGCLSRIQIFSIPDPNFSIITKKNCF
jgi:hypothetical protein